MGKDPSYEVVSFFPGSGQTAPAINLMSITIVDQQPNDVQSGSPAGFAPACDMTIAAAFKQDFMKLLASFQVQG